MQVIKNGFLQNDDKENIDHECLKDLGISHCHSSTDSNFAIPSKFQKRKNEENLMSSSPVPKRKPSINFHSIEDIVNGTPCYVPSTSPTQFSCKPLYLNDSGFMNLSKAESNESDSESKASTPAPSDDSAVGLDVNGSGADEDGKTKHKKKERTTFTETQRYVLEQMFIQNQYPDPETTEMLAKRLNLDESKIKVWFQNKRSREKKKNREQVTTPTAPVHPIANNPVSSVPANHPSSNILWYNQWYSGGYNYPWPSVNLSPYYGYQ